MSMLETAATVQDQILEAIKIGEEAVLSAFKTVTDAVEPVTSRLPDSPLTANLADPADVIEQAFGFANKLLATQKDFAVELAKVLAPGSAAGPVSAKSTPKSAPKGS